jgi:hypothetical protein
LEAFHISVSFICAAIWLTDSIFWLSKRVFVFFLSYTRVPSRIISILSCDLCTIVMYWLFGCSSVSLTSVQSCSPYLSLDVHKQSTTLRSLFLDMWFEIRLTLNNLWFKDDRRPPLPQKWLFHFWSLSITIMSFILNWVLIRLIRQICYILLVTQLSSIYKGRNMLTNKKQYQILLQKQWKELL